MKINDQSKPKTYSLFGLTISNMDYDSIIHLTSNAISSEKKITIGYVNPHIARYAQNDSSLKSIINSFTFNHLDGIGMELACRLLIKDKNIFRLHWTWTDGALKYIRECENNNWKIFLLGSDEDTLAKAMKNILKNFPALELVGSLNGYNGLNEFTVNKINESGTNILWVGIGSLRQEAWIINNFEKLNCNVIQSVGDLFNDIAGNRLRGPAFLRKLGFEWTFRLIQHPIKYFNRYVIGIPYFIFLILIYKFNGYKKISGKI